MQLKILRVMARMTQAEAAEAVCVNQTTISDWERGEYKPSPAAREKLAKAYGVSLAEIVKAVEAGVSAGAEADGPEGPAACGCRMESAGGECAGG